MSQHRDSDTVYWLQQPQWLFVGGSLLAAAVALIAEGPGSYIGLLLVTVCVAAISLWSLCGKPSLYWVVVIVAAALLLLGWSVEEPEPALFQSVLIATAVGWRIEHFYRSVSLLLLLAAVPLLGSIGALEADWAWWNWSVGTVLTWSLGRVIRLLDQTLDQLTEARSRLIDSAAREERLRISRDVHDLVGHSLTAMLLNIRAARRALKTDSEETRQAQQALHDAEQVGTSGIADIRAALIDIRTDVDQNKHSQELLASLPDGETVLQLLQRQEHIEITTKGPIATLSGPIAVAVYRVLQECITNISRHAAPGSALISLCLDTNEVEICAENPLRERDWMNPAISEKTLGLIGMRERVTSLGGTFTAGLVDGQWRVHCRIPCRG